MLLASAKGVGDYSLQVDTYERDNKAAAFQAKMGRPAGAGLSESGPGPEPVRPEAPRRGMKIDRQDLDIQRLVKEGLLKEEDSATPGARPLKIVDGHLVPTLPDLPYLSPSPRRASTASGARPMT